MWWVMICLCPVTPEEGAKWSTDGCMERWDAWVDVFVWKEKYSSFLFLFFFLLYLSPLSPSVALHRLSSHFNAFKINTNLTKCKNNHAMNAYFNNVAPLLFTPLWSCCRHRNDNPCWDSVASSQQIWMLNPLAKHHSQSELVMINNPTREIWLGETEAGDLREWATAMSALSGLSEIGNHTPRKHEMFICNGLCRLFFLKHGVGPEIGSLVPCN